jgi:PIN domain nuclease of toxin-antitoxin system
LSSPERLSSKAREAILNAQRAGEEIACSPVSLFEIAYAAHRKRLRLNVSTEDFIKAMESRLQIVPLTAPISIQAAELPLHFHGDPMDRIIAATAIVEDCPLLTADGRIRDAAVCKTLW